jgi:phage-related protein
LAEQGHLLRRPEADYLREGIHELRARHKSVRYRILYFFHGRGTAVISHGFSKSGAKVPAIEVRRAVERSRAYRMKPEAHTHEER